MRGGQGQDRTADPTLFRRVLYQLSYLTGVLSVPYVAVGCAVLLVLSCLCSDPDGTRTRDLRRDRAAR